MFLKLFSKNSVISGMEKFDLGCYVGQQWFHHISSHPVADNAYIFGFRQFTCDLTSPLPMAVGFDAAREAIGDLSPLVLSIAADIRGFLFFFRFWGMNE